MVSFFALWAKNRPWFFVISLARCSFLRGTKSNLQAAAAIKILSTFASKSRATISASSFP
jgi:hypothetical protein